MSEKETYRTCTSNHYADPRTHHYTHPHHFHPHHTDTGRRHAGSHIHCCQNSYTGPCTVAQLFNIGINWLVVICQTLLASSYTGTVLAL